VRILTPSGEKKGVRMKKRVQNGREPEKKNSGIHQAGKPSRSLKAEQRLSRGPKKLCSLVQIESIETSHDETKSSGGKTIRETTTRGKEREGGPPHRRGVKYMLSALAGLESYVHRLSTMGRPPGLTIDSQTK